MLRNRKALLIGGILSFPVVLICGCNFLLFGSPWRYSIREPLADPVAVTGWTEKGLHLANGQTIMPRGMTQLPKNSVILFAATREGVELKPDGRVIGLIKMFHKCGNDPVASDQRRVDIARLLAFYHEGVTILHPKPMHIPPPVLGYTETWFHQAALRGINEGF